MRIAALKTPRAPQAETEIMARARKGDAGAFELIMRRNNQRLFRVARSILKDEAEAEDVVQETYLRAFTHLDGVVNAASLSAWLAKVATNEALGRVRRRRPAASLDGLDAALMSPGSATFASLSALNRDNPEAAAARAEIRGLVESAIDRLPQGFRTVFVLRAIEELSVEETALCLGIPKQTVKSRFHRAKLALRRALSEQLEAALNEAFPFGGRRCDRVVAKVLFRLRPPSVAGNLN